MKTLLAPSETKIADGVGVFDISSLLFSDLTSHRIKLLHTYTNILQRDDNIAISKMFGLKKAIDIERYKRDIIYEPTLKAIERYTGVAFEYLSYSTLNSSAKEYIDTNIIIFSNLFGPISASDYIPDYRLKQGESVGDIKVDRFYKEKLSTLMDSYLRGEEILDLRATFYNKIYKPSLPYTTLKFLKNGKVVSHWAKAYRGLVLRELAISTIDSLDEFIKMPIEGLGIEEIITKKLHREIIYNIL